MSGNRAVAYKGPGVVEVIDTAYPELRTEGRAGSQPRQRRPQGARTGSSCGPSRPTSAAPTSTWCAAAPPLPQGWCSGTRSPARSSRAGPDVEFIKIGDIVSVPFNIACGRCRNCKEGKTGICLNVNPDRPGSAYGYVDMGGWVGGQAEYVLVPYADWNLLKFPDKDQAMEKILDLTMLSDIFPTGFHGAVTAGVGAGLHRLRRRRRARWGWPCAAGAQLLGAAVVIVGDMNEERLAQAQELRLRDHRPHARASLADQIEQILGVPEVDCGRRLRRLRGPRPRRRMPRIERPATVLNSLHGGHRAPAARSASPGCTSPATRAASTRPPRSASLVASASAWAGRSRTRFTPASAR